MDLTIVVAGILWSDNAVLIGQRARGARQPLWWEFPGGKVEPGESEPAALARELREELELEVEVGPLLTRLRHRYAEAGVLELAFYEIAAWRGPLRNRVYEQIAWVAPGALDGYALLPADAPVTALLQGRRRESGSC